MNTERDDLNLLLYGQDDTTGIVALELLAHKDKPDEMQLFIRDDSGIRSIEEPFRPFLWLSLSDLLEGSPTPFTIKDLDGDGVFRHLVFFESWKDLQKTIKWLKQETGRNPSERLAPFYYVNDAVQQHLLLTGRTLFRGMMFHDIHRMQVDIETYTHPDFEFPNPERESDRIIAIALADQSGWTEVLSGTEMNEAAMLKEFVDIVRTRDPDVLEGHNIFKFDLSYIQARCKLLGIPLTLGRDGSKARSRPGRYVIAEQSISYPKFDLFGRHIVDTYFLAQAYDVAHRSLESLGLKSVATHFGVAANNRTYIDGNQIARVFETDPEKVMRYARDDILETRAVSDVLSPSYYVQAQILPLSYQNITVRGNGTKIDALLLREYLRKGHTLEHPDVPREFAGGYTDIFFTGVAENVHHCDIRSLYPSLMLQHEYAPRSDKLRVFLQLLSHLKNYRLEAKKKMQTAATDEEYNYQDALQSTFKILINSFYGYLGFSQARFSDFDAAEAVAARGREVLRGMIAWIREHGGQPIEIDTDGIYYVPPEFESEAMLQDFRDAFQASLPEGLEIEFDGIYPAMFSYKMKNYALLTETGEVTIKGAALKSRGLEPFQRAYMREWLELLLSGKEEAIPPLQETYRAAIRDQAWPITKLAKTETLQDSPATYKSKVDAGGRGRNAAYELALKSGRNYRAGDQVSYYVTGVKKSVAVHAHAKLVATWDENERDENVAYYLAKLESLFKKFDDTPTASAQTELELG